MTEMTHAAGIVAHSPDGSALCYLAFCQAGFAHSGRHEHPDLSLHYTAMGWSIEDWETGNLDSIRRRLATSINKLAAGGASFFLCADNTAHIALEHPGPRFAIPGLNIADIVADRAVADGRRKVGVLGTVYTMNGPVYRRALLARGIEAMIPEPDEQAQLNRIIYDELVRGIFTAESRGIYCDIIARMATRGCDAVALVCTEIPLLVAAKESPLPAFDSTRLLARAGFEVGIGARPFPTWQGGPLGEQV